MPSNPSSRPPAKRGNKNVAVCTPRRLPKEALVKAAERACKINPLNFAPIHRLERVMPGFAPTRDRLAVVVTKYWGNAGIQLTVGFMDNPDAETRRKILENMNAWNQFANVVFVETEGDAHVRIAREGGDNGGYWSYIGTDILQISTDQPTMNLEGFTADTSDSEYIRVVRHETGHTLGFPHEHMRNDLIQLLDRDKTIKYFMDTQGWSEQEVINQVLTPIEESSLIGTDRVDGDSIMCYQIPGTITLSGDPIPGGRDIDELDAEFVGKIYPKPQEAPKLVNGGKPASPVSISSGISAGTLDVEGGITIDILPGSARISLRRKS